MKNIHNSFQVLFVLILSVWGLSFAEPVEDKLLAQERILVKNQKHTCFVVKSPKPAWESYRVRRIKSLESSTYSVVSELEKDKTFEVPSEVVLYSNDFLVQEQDTGLPQIPVLVLQLRVYSLQQINQEWRINEKKRVSLFKTVEEVSEVSLKPWKEWVWLHPDDVISKGRVTIRAYTKGTFGERKIEGVPHLMKAELDEQGLLYIPLHPFIKNSEGVIYLEISHPNVEEPFHVVLNESLLKHLEGLQKLYFNGLVKSKDFLKDEKN